LPSGPVKIPVRGKIRELLKTVSQRQTEGVNKATLMLMFNMYIILIPKPENSDKYEFCAVDFFKIPDWLLSWNF
jgi:hypothetical protein